MITKISVFCQKKFHRKLWLKMPTHLRKSNQIPLKKLENLSVHSIKNLKKNLKHTFAYSVICKGVKDKIMVEQLHCSLVNL